MIGPCGRGKGVMQFQGSVTDKDQSGMKTILTAMQIAHEEQNSQVSAQSQISGGLERHKG